ncbi:zinc-ribbon domain-containing protein [Arthrobacter sp. JZ12]|uniref:zinc-ribbon domain-containing protein n=1 Tax=Arthrobacter sp. JZ12 TaxID=2654190 RepID=UPI002B48E5B7|nr:zinc-ribbon domain-containing protein [Arthrobacter sp. JZ12]WRH23718.1 zinc-ribbon domain-containing protein [Arthrobacter sp. JZ12]
MLILFGFNTRVKELFRRQAVCSNCGQHASQRVDERSTRFTVFFIPLFTTRRRYSRTCAWCGITAELSKSEKNALA